MSIFKYKLPSGSTYEVEGPAGATQADADKIFYSQVAAGSVAGYRAGDVLTSVETKLNKLGLSRKARGIAGTDDDVILAVINQQPISGPLPNLISTPIVNPIDQQEFATVIYDEADGTSLGPAKVGPLTATSVQSLLAQAAAIVNQPYNVITAEKGVGKYGFSCLQLEMTGYIKPGTYERYLKEPTPTTTLPGVVNLSAYDESQFLSVMNSPSVWTGKNGVTDVSGILNNNFLQNQIKTQAFQQSYQSLTSIGTIVEPVSAAVSKVQSTIFNSPFSQAYQNLTNINQQNIGALVSNAAEFGANLTDQWSKGIDVGAAIQSTMDEIGKSAEYAIDFAQNQISGIIDNIGDMISDAYDQVSEFVTNGIEGIKDLIDSGVESITNLVEGGVEGLQKLLENGLGELTKLVNLDNINGIVDMLTGGLGSLIARVEKAAAYVNTVNRATVDVAVDKIIGNPKVPSPEYTDPKTSESAAAKEDIKTAESKLAAADDAAMMAQIRREQAATDPNWKLSGTSR